MFTNVVVGVDAHEGGRDAIALATLLIEAGGAMRLAHIYHGEAHRLHLRHRAEHDAEDREHATELLQAARGETGVDADLWTLESTSVGRGLHVLAEELYADLLVVGSSRRGLLDRVFLGDDTHAALNGAPCAIAIAPTGFSARPGAMREVGVAYNGSPQSEQAITVARAIAAEHDAKLSACEVISLPRYAFVGGPAPTDGAIEELIGGARAEIERLGDIDAHASYGLPGEELALYSASIDLLIVGSRDYGPVGRLVHGSLSQLLAHSARCPLLVLTRAARAADAVARAAETSLAAGTDA